MTPAKPKASDAGTPIAPPGQRDYRIALVGCGRISKNHFDALAAVEGLSLAAVCDSDEERARAAGEAQDVPWFRSYETMLRDSPADVVTIATPSGLHPQHGVLAARAGKHVVTEKPMATRWQDAKRMVAACDAADPIPALGDVIRIAERLQQPDAPTRTKRGA